MPVISWGNVERDTKTASENHLRVVYILITLWCEIIIFKKKQHTFKYPHLIIVSKNATRVFTICTCIYIYEGHPISSCNTCFSPPMNDFEIKLMAIFQVEVLINQITQSVTIYHFSLRHDTTVSLGMFRH